MTTHIAIMVQPYLQYVLSGRKTLESRFSHHRIVPFGCVSVGDQIYLKLSGGAVVAECVVQQVQYVEGSPIDVAQVCAAHPELCASPNYIAQKSQSRFGTLMWLGPVHPVHPFQVTHVGRNGWIVLNQDRTIGEVQLL
jgi:hypothetical protein